MLGGKAVGLGHRLGDAVDQDNLAVITPRGAGDVGGRQPRELGVDFALQIVGEFLRRGDQNRRRCRAVFGLAEQVGGDHLHIGRLIGDH